ncbi:MAG: hypothetical protein ABI885_23855 [Gammaproteobacteria bacterium]
MEILHRSTSADVVLNATTGRSGSKQASKVRLGVAGGNPVRPGSGRHECLTLVLAAAGPQSAGEVPPAGTPPGLRM